MNDILGDSKVLPDNKKESVAKNSEKIRESLHIIESYLEKTKEVLDRIEVFIQELREDRHLDKRRTEKYSEPNREDKESLRMR